MNELTLADIREKGHAQARTALGPLYLASTRSPNRHQRLRVSMTQRYVDGFVENYFRPKVQVVATTGETTVVKPARKLTGAYKRFLARSERRNRRK